MALLGSSFPESMDPKDEDFIRTEIKESLKGMQLDEIKAFSDNISAIVELIDKTAQEMIIIRKIGYDPVAKAKSDELIKNQQAEEKAVELTSKGLDISKAASEFVGITKKIISKSKLFLSGIKDDIKETDVELKKLRTSTGGAKFTGSIPAFELGLEITIDNGNYYMINVKSLETTVSELIDYLETSIKNAKEIGDEYESEIKKTDTDDQVEAVVTKYRSRIDEFIKEVAIHYGSKATSIMADISSIKELTSSREFGWVGTDYEKLDKESDSNPRIKLFLKKAKLIGSRTSKFSKETLTGLGDLITKSVTIITPLLAVGGAGILKILKVISLTTIDLAVKATIASADRAIATVNSIRSGIDRFITERRERLSAEEAAATERRVADAREQVERIRRQAEEARRQAEEAARRAAEARVREQVEQAEEAERQALAQAEAAAREAAAQAEAAARGAEGLQLDIAGFVDVDLGENAEEEALAAAQRATAERRERAEAEQRAADGRAQELERRYQERRVAAEQAAAERRAAAEQAAAEQAAQAAAEEAARAEVEAQAAAEAAERERRRQEELARFAAGKRRREQFTDPARVAVEAERVRLAEEERAAAGPLQGEAPIVGPVQGEAPIVGPVQGEAAPVEPPQGEVRSTTGVSSALEAINDIPTSVEPETKLDGEGAIELAKILIRGFVKDNPTSNQEARLLIGRYIQKINSLSWLSEDAKSRYKPLTTGGKTYRRNRKGRRRTFRRK